MKRISVAGSVRSEKIFKIAAAVIMTAVILTAVLMECPEGIILAVALISSGLYFIFWALLLLEPTIVTFDDEWLMIKHLAFRKDIKMSNIDRVWYYIYEDSGKRKSIYYLVLRIEYDGGVQKLKEFIRKGEIEHCKRKEIGKEIFELYDHIEELYPKKARGYWRYCGI